jgi:hypothetical protein
MGIYYTESSEIIARSDGLAEGSKNGDLWCPDRNQLIIQPLRYRFQPRKC